MALAYRTRCFPEISLRARFDPMLTPIAMSEITAAQIEAKLGNKEFPEVLKMTPGVWATPAISKTP